MKYSFTRFLSVILTAALIVAGSRTVHAQDQPTVQATRIQPNPELAARIDSLAVLVEDNVITARRHIHEHPELSNREFETAKYVASRLEQLGIDVQMGIAHTGVVGVLRGGRPGPVVALRADMDALPVTEEVDLPFASRVRATYNGQEVGVMHACGHDGHVAMLLGAAEVLSKMRADLPGSVKFIFQPAEEGPPKGEEGGAELMVQEGVLASDPRPEVIFGLHVTSDLDVGQVGYRAGSLMASAEDMRIVVQGRQTHGAYPWRGIDPIVVASQIVLGLQTIPSRQVNVVDQGPAVVTIGRIDGGVRFNIIPDSVVMVGTIRTLDTEMQQDVHRRIRRTAEQIAASAGATAHVEIGAEVSYPITYNDPALARLMRPTLQRTVGASGVVEMQPVLGAEDFSFYQREIPGLFAWLGIRTPGADPDEFASIHSPRFRMDEDALTYGVRVLAHLAVDYMHAQ